MHQYTAKQIKRFRSNVVRRSKDECWEWQGSLSKAKYGRIGLNGIHLYAHRVAYELAYGEIPQGLEVCHSCDNPRCCNPNHLFAATHKQNMEDRDKKGRHRWGQRAFGLKVSSDGADRIRKEYANGNKTQEQIAVEFGITLSYVNRIIHNVARKDMDCPSPTNAIRTRKSRRLPLISAAIIQKVKSLSGCDDVRVIPDFPSYAITKDGQVWVSRGRGISDPALIKPNLRYKSASVKIYNENRGEVSLTIHRILSLVFKDN